jgi:ribosome maturation factor RimP
MVHHLRRWACSGVARAPSGSLSGTDIRLEGRRVSSPGVHRPLIRRRAFRSLLNALYVELKSDVGVFQEVPVAVRGRSCGRCVSLWRSTPAVMSL